MLLNVPLFFSERACFQWASRNSYLLMVPMEDESFLKVSVFKADCYG